MKDNMLRVKKEKKESSEKHPHPLSNGAEKVNQAFLLPLLVRQELPVTLKGDTWQIYPPSPTEMQSTRNLWGMAAIGIPSQRDQQEGVEVDRAGEAVCGYM